MKRFEGKVAIVTGGNSGIDLAEARRLHGEGARVAITSPDKAKLDEAEASIGENVVTVVIDLAKVTRIDRLLDLLSSRVATHNVLFVNAGIGRFAPCEKCLFHYPESDTRSQRRRSRVPL